MSIEDFVLVTAWAILLIVLAAVAPRFGGAFRLQRPEPQPLRLDPLSFDLDGPVIDMEPA